ncbi:MAG: hypothetical protein ACYDAO_09995 [Thermoplasmataceae archaeon]
MKVTERQKGNFDNEKFHELMAIVDKALKDKNNKNKMIVLDETDYKDVGKKSAVVINLRQYYNLTSKQIDDEEIGITSFRKFKETD